LLSDPADAWPAVLRNLSHVFDAFEVGWVVFSLVLSSLLAGWVGFVDIINAQNFEVMWAVMCEGDSNEGSDGNEQLHFGLIN
jgi:hypothetical protein